jgi:hypothetical protein
MLLFHTKKDGFNLQALDVLCVAVFFATATYGIKAMVAYVGFGAYEDQASLFWYLLWAFVYGKFLWYNKFMFKNLLVAEVVYIGLMYVNYRLFPLTHDSYDEYFMFIRQIVFVYIPSLTVALKVNNFSGYIVNFRKLGIFGIGFMIIAYFMNYTQRWDYQLFGVQLCPFVIMLYPSYLLYHNKSDLIWIIVGFLFLMAGGRQSFVGFFIGMMVVYYCIRLNHLTIKQLVVRLMLVLFLLLFIVLLLPYLIVLLGDVVNVMGMDSRTMDMLTGNELFSTSTRDSIYELSMFYIRSNLYDIKGLFADRYMLRITDSWIAYPHNLILELMMDFGVILGGLFSLIILFKFVLRLVRGNIEKSTIIGIIATSILVRLMVSSSFMIEGCFYTVLGLLFNSNGDKQIKI